MSIILIDPEKMAKTLGVWIVEPSTENEGDECSAELGLTTYILVLSREKKEKADVLATLMMSLSLTSEKPDFVSLSIHLPNNNGNTLLAFREITNVVYQHERRKVIIESNKNNYYSVLELTRVHEWINATLNTNLTKEEYEEDFRNY